MTTHEALRQEVAAIRLEVAAICRSLREVEGRLCRITAIADDVHQMEATKESNASSVAGFSLGLRERVECPACDNADALWITLGELLEVHQWSEARIEEWLRRTVIPWRELEEAT